MFGLFPFLGSVLGRRRSGLGAQFVVIIPRLDYSLDVLRVDIGFDSHMLVVHGR